MTNEREVEARQYLLGRLPEDDASALERGYFADPARVDDIAAAESELVDAYLAGTLSPADRAAFEAHYLASEVHRDRVATARLLRRAAVGRGSRRVVAAGWVGLLAAAAGLAGLVIWRSRPAERPPARVAAAPSATPAVTAPAVSATPAATAVPTAPRRGVSLALAAVRVRGDEGTPELRVPADALEVALELGHAGDVPAGVLSFAVRTIEGAPVASGRLERRRDALGVARVRAARLAPDDYIVAVSSDGTALAQYFFRVVP
jgi:hypothetical protein